MNAIAKALKLRKHYVEYKGEKVRVHYWIFNREGEPEVYVAQKDYGRELLSLFQGAKNNTDISTDYFEKSAVRLRKGDAHYDEALEVARALEKGRVARLNARYAREA